MKEYFIWVCEKLSRLWRMDIDDVGELIMAGHPVPQAYSIDIYLKEIRNE